ncbi:kinase-like domain-containing protein, partial [Cantharellus anzutake]|uniref:kinase-like domain-containing protein n=1 Tax=Cantharellus anzutake TaxID=1750568 RepID=UPI001908928D
MGSANNDKQAVPRDAATYASSSSGESRGRPKGRAGQKRTRSSNSRPIRLGYHAFTAFGHEFCVEKRWKFVRELGSGAYGVVVSVQDEITGETIAIKLITRAFDKVQLSKRALREITLLRHFNNHDNITGLIDMDVVGPDFNEMHAWFILLSAYCTLADLYQIIRSGQTLTDAHIRYFTYQILRGVKFIHSADVIHRDLKPGNLLVNSDCELKICDLGLSRGYNTKLQENERSDLTEYVATRWYRGVWRVVWRLTVFPVDMWSIGCILGELMGGKPIFKGKDYVDQLNLILGLLGTPSDVTIQRIGSEKARAYIRNLPFKKLKPWSEIFPNSDPDAVDLLSKLLTFDPSQRLTVNQALEHPFLAAYHDLDDEPENPEKFGKWREIERVETIDQFRAEIWKEVQEFRREVRSI